MSAVTLVNMALHALLISVIGWGFVRWCVPDARHRAWASLLVLHAAVIAPWLMEIRPEIPVSSPAEVSAASAVTSWKPDWKISATTIAPPRIHSETVNSANAEPAWTVADLARWACVVSMIGIVVMALHHCVMSMMAWRWRRSLRVPTREESAVLPSAAWHAPLLVSRDDVCPCVVGLWQPVIAVPQRIITGWTSRQWTWLLRHEGEHLRSRDTLTAWLLGWTKALLWWNPFVHALVEQWSQAREEICDGAAVRGETDSTAYSGFLLDIAASVRAPSPMLLPMAASRPARRLRARMTAMLAKRSVREKVSRLFLLGTCAILASIAALVSCVGLKAEELPARKPAEPEAASPKAEPASSTELYTRTFRVWSEFVKRPVTALEMLKGQGIPFPEGASASFVPSTKQLIVRNTVVNLERIELFLEGQRNAAPVQVHLEAKWITVDTTIPYADYSTETASLLHGKDDWAILADEQYQAIVRNLSQRKGVDLLSAPGVTFRFGQQATVEVIREFSGNPKGLPNPDFIGPQNVYLVEFDGDKLKIEMQADLGELDDKERATPQVRHLRKSATLLMGVGETLFLRMGDAPTFSKRKVLLFVTAKLIDLKGNVISAEEARRLLNEARTNPPGREEGSKPGVPDRDKVPLTADLSKRLELLLSTAYNYYNLGDYENSTKAFQDAVRIDPYNSAARRGMERVEQKRSELFDVARNRTRAKMLAEAGIPDSKGSGGTYYAQKMEKIIFPQVQFKGATVEEAVEFLRIKSRDYDTVERNPAKKGVNLLMKPGMAPTTSLINLDLKDVSMSEALKKITELGRVKYKIEEFAVVVVPLSEPGTDAKAPDEAKSADVSVWIADISRGKEDEKWYEVISNFLPKQRDLSSVDSDPKAEKAMSMAEATERGIFPPHNYVVSGVFTPEQHDLLKRALESRKDIKTVTLPTVTTVDGKVANFKQDDKGMALDIELASGPEGYTWDVAITIRQRLTDGKTQSNTTVTIWDGQTVAMGCPLEKDKEGPVTRMIFITVKAKK